MAGNMDFEVYLFWHCRVRFYAFFGQPLSEQLFTYRDLRAKRHRDKIELFALEKPADWSYEFFTSEKRLDALIGYIIIFTSEKN